MDTEDLKRQLNDVVDRWAASQARPTPVVGTLDGGVSTVSFSPPAEVAPEPTRELPKDKRAVRTNSSGDRVFLLDEVKKTRSWVSKPEVLDASGFTMADVVTIEDEELLKYGQSAPLV
jgi:hypothetical protein